jgi:uncharacterized protein YjiS (DUF1127 family)
MRRTLSTAVLSAAAALRAARHTRRNARVLHQLSDATLKDIGLTRSGIWRVAHDVARSIAD